jgi:hypothetical protein
MEVIGFIIGIALVAWLNHYLATQRGRNAVGWAIGGAVFGLLATILLLILGKTEAREVEIYKKANSGQ